MPPCVILIGICSFHVHALFLVLMPPLMLIYPRCQVYFPLDLQMVNFELSIAVEILLYAPPRPLVDFSVAFLWLMSIGTIVCASLWSDLTTPEKSDERYNELCPKVFPCNPISAMKFIICT